MYSSFVRSLIFVSLLLFTGHNVFIVSALRILLTNDDPWDTANFRALYQVLFDYGHDVVICTPASEPIDAEGKLRKACKLFLQSSGTPETSGSSRSGAKKPDIAIVGPHQGPNVGSTAAARSKTFRIAKDLVETHGIPSIAVSTLNKRHRSYRDLEGKDDQAYKYARATLALITALESAAVQASLLDRPEKITLKDAKGKGVEPYPDDSSAGHADRKKVVHLGEIEEEVAEKGTRGEEQIAASSSSSRTPIALPRMPQFLPPLPPGMRLLPESIGLNVNLADAEGLSLMDWHQREWVLTRMTRTKWEKKLPFVRSCSKGRPPSEEDILSSSKFKDKVHTISLFRTDSDNGLQPKNEDNEHVANLLKGRLEQY